jgi:hypothetical protein
MREFIMKRVFVLGASVAALTACQSGEVFDPVHCDYEQAQSTAPAVMPADRSEWVDYDGDGVVVLCMWTGVVD